MNSTRCKAILYVMTATVSALLWGGPVRAQQNTQDQNTQAAAPAQGPELQEVTVTARKREESLLDVPVIEAAIPAAKLQSLQTVDMSDLANIVPGLQFGRNLLAIGTQVSLRGIGTSSYDQGVDSSVALSIDGMEPGSGLAFESGLFDLAQVEVLKGPQSLFFGKSTTGGVISLRTADPTDQSEVIATEAYEFESITPREELILSGPVADTIKLRLASMYSTSQGYFYDRGVATPGLGGVTPTNARTPNSTDYIVRLTALWNPNSQFDARLKLNAVHDDIINQENSEFSDCPEGNNFAPVGIHFLGNIPCQISRDSYVVWLSPAAFPGVIDNGIPTTDNYQRYGTLEMNYRPTEHLTLTSVTTSYLLESTDLVAAIETYGAASTLGAENFFRRTESTEELRLNSDFSGPLNFTVGGFYEDGFISEHVALPGNTALGFPNPLPSGDIDSVTIKTESAFGQLRYKILPRLELAAGARYSDEERSETPVNTIPYDPALGALLQLGQVIPVPTPVEKSINTAPEVTLTYRPTDEMTAYGAYKQGYKSGSFTLSTPPISGVTNAFGEEKAQGGEVGLKSLWLEHRLSLNAAAYLYNYSGLQVGAITPAVNGIINIETVNAGAARSYGIDFDGAYIPAAVQQLQLNASVLWNHARYITLDNVPCWGGQTIALGCNQTLLNGLYQAQNLNGTPMVRAPNWQLNLGVDYTWDLANDHKIVITNNEAISSAFVNSLAIGRPNDDNYQTGYMKVDLSLSLHGPHDGWELALIGKDLNDKLTAGVCSAANYAGGVIIPGIQITGGNSSGISGIDQEGCFVDPGREVWVRLTVRPFAGSQ